MDAETWPVHDKCFLLCSPGPRADAGKGSDNNFPPSSSPGGQPFLLQCLQPESSSRDTPEGIGWWGPAGEEDVRLHCLAGGPGGEAFPPQPSP